MRNTLGCNVKISDIQKGDLLNFVHLPTCLVTDTEALLRDVFGRAEKTRITVLFMDDQATWFREITKYSDFEIHNSLLALDKITRDGEEIFVREL